MKQQQLLPLLPLLPLLLLLAPSPTATCPANLNTVYTSIDPATKGITQLGIQLLQEFGGQRNLLVSPFSVWNVLAMVNVGAEGETARELSKALGLSGKAGVLSLLRDLQESLQMAAEGDKEVTLDIANRIYIEEGYAIQNCQTELANMMAALNLEKGIEASQTMNRYVSETTRGLIPEIIAADKLGPLTRMVALNAIYFRGLWTTPFPVDSTSLRPFYVGPENKEVQVEAMFRSQMPVKIGESQALSARVLQLSYASGLFSMTIMLPTGTGEAGLNATISALSPTTLSQALTQLQPDYYDVQIPKFEIRAKFGDDLKKALEKMGVKKVFTTSADLSSFHQELRLKHIMQRAVITVDEAGSKAAAATTAVFVTKIGNAIHVNRPFVFIIHDKDNMVLFFGVYRRP